MERMIPWKYRCVASKNFVSMIQKFRKHDGTIACFDTDDERNITSTGIYHDELFEKDFIGIGFD